MSGENSNLIDKQFEYNLWANTQLIALCATLDQDQLEMEVEGVFGRIQPTIVHLVRAEGGLYRRPNRYAAMGRGY